MTILRADPILAFIAGMMFLSFILSARDNARYHKALEKCNQSNVKCEKKNTAKTSPRKIYSIGGSGATNHSQNEEYDP